MGVLRRLERERLARGDAAVALIGAGFVGRGIAYQLGRTPGLRPAIIVNRTIAHAVDAYRTAGYDVEQVLVSEDQAELEEAILAGRPCVSTHYDVLADLPVEVVMEATGSHEYGALAIRACLESGHDVVSMNAEADATVGYLLKRIADRHNAVYSIADGDQPGVLMRLVEFVEASGFETVAAINCKGFMDRHATPESIKEWSVKQGTSLPMTTSFTDGTKMNIEQAVVANAFGLLPEKRGMHGVLTELATVTQDMEAALTGHGSVEYTLGGDFRGGVFVMGYNDDADLVQGPLQFLKMGDGPYYTFYRPYHLVHIEVPVSIAEVHLYREPTIVTAGPFITDVVALAKRDLEPGDQLDGIGGWDTYGEIDKIEHINGFLPIGLIEGARIVKPVKMDEPIPLDAVEIDSDRPLVQMRAEQDALSN